MSCGSPIDAGAGIVFAWGVVRVRKDDDSVVDSAGSGSEETNGAFLRTGGGVIAVGSVVSTDNDRCLSVAVGADCIAGTDGGAQSTSGGIGAPRLAALDSNSAWQR